MLSSVSAGIHGITKRQDNYELELSGGFMTNQRLTYMMMMQFGLTYMLMMMMHFGQLQMAYISSGAIKNCAESFFLSRGTYFCFQAKAVLFHEILNVSVGCENNNFQHEN